MLRTTPSSISFLRARRTTQSSTLPLLGSQVRRRSYISSATIAPKKTVAEIVASAKAAPEKWSFATAQLGAPGHLAAVTFNQLTGIDIPIIAYRGTAPAA